MIFWASMLVRRRMSCFAKKYFHRELCITLLLILQGNFHFPNLYTEWRYVATYEYFRTSAVDKNVNYVIKCQSLGHWLIKQFVSHHLFHFFFFIFLSMNNKIFFEDQMIFWRLILNKKPFFPQENHANQRDQSTAASSGLSWN